MTRGLYTAGVGMMVQMNRMDVVTNNISNVNTTGYKKDGAITQTFSDEVMKALDDKQYKLITQNKVIGSVNLGNFVSSIHTDFSQGPLTETDGTYDLAVNGQGFFVVEGVNSEGNLVEKYTRDGSFTVNAERILVTKTGEPVIGQNGEITIPDGKIVINKAGEIFSDGVYVDKLKMVDVSNKHSLRKVGDSLYESIPQTEFSDFEGEVLSGYLEASNVNIVNEMVNLINISKVYEASQKAVKASDELLQRATNELGKK